MYAVCVGWGGLGVGISVDIHLALLRKITGRNFTQKKKIQLHSLPLF